MKPTQPILFLGLKALLLLWLVCSIPCWAEPTPDDQEEAVDSLQTLLANIEQILEEEKVPGAGIAIVSSDENIWVGGLGLADLETERKADADTMWRIGSISKMFVSLSMLMLEERGLLSLDDILRQHVPEIEFENRWSKATPIRLVHTLEHTTGFDDLHLNEYALNIPDIELREAYAFNPRSRRSRWEPGKFATYGNANPPLAAYVLEKTTGQAFENFIAEKFFEPLGMDDASFFLDEQTESLLAKGYQSQKNKLKPTPYWHIIMRPSGSINASTRDMARFVRFFLNRGKLAGQRLLNPKSIQRMETPHTSLAARKGLALGYGLNNIGGLRHGHVWHGHGGGMSGYLANLQYAPKAGVGYAVMINSNSRALNRISSKISAYLTEGLPKLERPPLPELDATSLQRLEGVYRPIAIRNQMNFSMARLTFTQISEIDGKLKGTSMFGKPFSLTPAGGSLFYQGEQVAPTAAIIEDEDNYLYLQRGPFDASVRVPAWRAWGELVIAILCGALMISTLLFLLVAGAGRLFHRFKKVQHWNIRFLPAYATLCLLISYAILVPYGSNLNALFTNFGNMTVPSAASYILGWGVLVFSLLGLYELLRSRSEKLAIHKIIKAYLLSANAACLVYAMYVLYWTRGIPIWVY